MNNLTKKLIVAVVTMAIALTAFGKTINTGNGSIEVRDGKIKYGTSAKYNPNSSTKTMRAQLKKRVKDLQKAKKDLIKLKKKAEISSKHSNTNSKKLS